MVIQVIFYFETIFMIVAAAAASPDITPTDETVNAKASSWRTYHGDRHTHAKGDSIPALFVFSCSPLLQTPVPLCYSFIFQP